jgi:selenocysteine-specific elongation factor
MTIDLILGTAGHIDHGKTALVKALTGVDTDRLPEEKRRGITIDLGFAELDLGEYRLGIVDVPGHERFVRNMLAGATGIDLALLVVAADDSIKPQTREHLEILRLLDLEAGVVALTKCDLTDPEWVELVEDEIRGLVAGTFLADAPLVRTSVVTGEGLDELRGALAEAARRAAASPRRRREAAPFRLAIDRAFTIAGHGTIVTGSVSSGQVRVGEELVLEPGETSVRVRSLENHGHAVEEVHRGQRAAVNLAGIHHEQLQRGQELAAPGHLVPSRLLSVRVNLLDTVPRPLKNRSRVRLHIGTAELMAAVVLLDRDELLPGEEGFAQLFLSQPAVSVWGQPAILRSQSPVMTIGGAIVLDPNALKIRRNDGSALGRLAELTSTDPLPRASAAACFLGWRDWQPPALARTAGIDGAQAVYNDLVQRGEVIEIAVSPTRVVRVHRAVLEELSNRIEAALARLHEQSPLQTAFDRTQLQNRFAYLGDEAILETVLKRMAAARRIELSQRGVALAGRGPKLSGHEKQLLEWIVDLYRRSGFQPPAVEQVKSQATRNQAAVPSLVELATAQGRLIKVAPEFYLHAEVESHMRDLITTRLAKGQGMTVSEIREALNTTRKYAVPFCEYLDRIGLTQRQGDLRTLRTPESGS